MTISPALSHSSLPPAGATVADQPPGLAEEHDHLLCQVAARAEDLLAAVGGDHWPARELDALVGYLRAEILQQVTEEELLLFPTCAAPPDRHHLACEHARLRAGIAVLELAAGNGRRSPAMLAGAVSDLLRQLEAHLAAEETILAACRARQPCLTQ